LPSDGGLSAPLSYAFLSASPAMICTAVVWAREGGSGSGVVVVAGVLVQVLAYWAYLTMWPLALYWSARVFRIRDLTYRAVLRIVCYASGLNGLFIITLLPWSGIAAVVYTGVVCVFCIATAARVTVLRALGVYGTTAFLAACAYVLSIMLAVMSTDS
jgi:hypothetical protein